MECEDRSLMSHKSTAKLNIWKTAFLIMAQMMGGGVLSMPHIIYCSKMFGIVGIVVIGFFSCYGSILIGRCMVIIENEITNSDVHIHSPFTYIGEICYGKIGREVVRWFIVFTSFGIGVVFLLLTAELASELNLPLDLSYCNWIIIFGILHVFPSFFPSPKDLWQIGVFSVASSIVPFVLVFALMISNYSNAEDRVSKPFEPTAWTVITSISSLVFFNSASQANPTIQFDMKHKKDFAKASSFAYLGVVSFYLFFGLLSYTLLTEDVNPDILSSLPPSKLLSFIRTILIFHMIVSNIIQINPLFQELEKCMKISIEFSFKMALSRTAMMAVITLAGLTIPKFNYVLNIIGATTIPFLAFICPSLFYLKLASRSNNDYRISFTVKCFIIIIIVFGLLASLVSTFVAMHQVISSETSAKSCFIK